ncbi:MAG: 23S rRNA (guanosine(2251)-2'-O)-methyltransferase RlmB [bacterium]
MTDYVYGRNPVAEWLDERAGDIEKIYVANPDQKVADMVTEATDKSIPVEEVPRRSLNEMSEGSRHQGVVARVGGFNLLELSELLDREMGSPRRIIVIDQLQDPVNLGKVTRSACFFGVDGIVKTTDRTAPLSGTVLKTSAGAAAHVPFAEVTNLRRALETLKDERLWIVGADLEGDVTPGEVPRDRDLAIVIGNEEEGIRRLTRETCDYLVKIPGQGSFDSLNAATASAVLQYALQPQPDSS